ncbi:MAG: SIS domain-containing protein [Patescibacteria group bacterium]|nr:SIS domain-containing protein [Patescibacteria group bacterium]
MKSDEAKVLSSISGLKNQCQDVWHAALRLKIKKQKVKNIVVAGMGGSALGAHIVLSVFGDSLESPFVIVNNYFLPEFVNKDTLVILSSYSGNTEEALSCLEDAKKRKAKIVCLTSGGLLEKRAKQNKISLVIFDTKHNPSGAPRFGLGYSIFGILGILSKTGVLKIKKPQVNILIQKDFSKKMAKKLYGKIPVVVGSEFLVGNLHAFQNQLHETAKNFACYFELPELNHHLMEGLDKGKKNLVFLFLESNFYHKKNQKRYSLTKEIVKKNKISIVDYKLKSKDKLLASLECLAFSSLVSFYLGALNRVNPVENPWVDYFKKKLK